MVKKIICLGMALALILSLTGCTGCVSLKTYKANAKIKLDNYIRKLPDSFSELLPTFEDVEAKNYINGLKVDKIVNDGKNSIDNASNKKDVDAALGAAKREFDTIPIVFPMPYSSPTVDGDTGSWGFHFFFYLKIFDENISYEAAAGVGAILSFPRAEDPLPPIYEGYFGRQPQIIRWYVGRTEIDGGTFEILYEQDIIDFIIKIDDAIIGYIVVEMNYSSISYNTPKLLAYTPKLLAYVVNPKIDGTYQAMDEDQVQIEIASIKEKND